MTETDLTALKQELKKLIVKECDKDIEPMDIDDEEQLIGGPGLALDSLDALQISMAVKTHYGVRIEGGQSARAALRNINSLAQTIADERSHS